MSGQEIVERDNLSLLTIQPLQQEMKYVVVQVKQTYQNSNFQNCASREKAIFYNFIFLIFLLVHHKRCNKQKSYIKTNSRDTIFCHLPALLFFFLLTSYLPELMRSIWAWFLASSAAALLLVLLRSKLLLLLGFLPPLLDFSTTTSTDGALIPRKPEKQSSASAWGQRSHSTSDFFFLPSPL